MIEIDVVCATARQNGAIIDLPPRELALLTTLAIRKRSWPSYQLVPLLWPRAPGTRSSSLKVYIHRLRQRLGHACISSTNKGYELGAHVRVALWEVQGLLRQPILSDAQRQTLSRFYFTALSADRSFLSRWDWFEGSEALINAAISDVALRLAQEALARDLRDEAGTIVRSAALLNPAEARLHEWQATAIS